MTHRIGLLGGTFNPVHNGHIDLGLHIREAFDLDEILYILAAKPPHKKSGNVASARLRWQMLEMALAPFPFLVPCDIEMKRPQESYTIDTIAQLKGTYPGRFFYFISGSEGFLKIRTWKMYKKLLGMVSFIVVLRENRHRNDVEQLLNTEGIPTRNFDGDSVAVEEGAPIAYLYKYRSATLHISSTMIRRKVWASEHIDCFVDGKVKKIMEDNRLYEK